MTGFKEIEGPYSNHVGGAFTHLITGAVYFLVTWRENSQGTYWLQVWEDLPPYGDPQLVRKWSADPWGYGTHTWLPDGSLYVIAPGSIDDTGKVKPAVHIETGLFPPIPLDSDLLSRLARLEAFFAVPGTLTLGPQDASKGAGGEIRLADGKGGFWAIDATSGNLRAFVLGQPHVALLLPG